MKSLYEVKHYFFYRMYQPSLVMRDVQSIYIISHAACEAHTL